MQVKKSKFTILMSLLVMASLLLAACADNTAGNNDLGTPGVGDETLLPTTDLGDDDLLETPTVDVLDETLEVEATEPLVATATAVTGLDETATPVAGVDDGMGMAAVDRLSALLDYGVRNQNGDVVGEVDGLLVMRNNVVSEETMDDADDADSGDMQTTGTPEAGDDMGDATAMMSGQGGAQLTYVVVNLDDDFLVDDVDNSADTMTTPEAGTDTGVMAAADEVLVPFTAFQPVVGTDDLDSPALVLSIDDQTLASAPVFDREGIDFTAAEWDSDLQAYWTGEGLNIPVTGDGDATAGALPVLIEDSFDDIDVHNVDGEDLGEIEEFIIDPQSGQFRYAILAAGGFLGLGESYIPVPMEQIHWVNEDDDMDDLGEIVLNVPEDTFNNAPSFDSMDTFDTTVEGWEADIEAFWQSLTNDVE